MQINNLNYNQGRQLMDDRPETSWQPFMKPKDYAIPNLPQTLYLLNINTVGTGSEVEIALKLFPDTVTEQYSARMIQEAPFGSFSPRNFYVGGSGKVLSFSFTLIEDENSAIGIDEKETLYNLLHNLKGMSAPVYDAVSETIKPPIVYFQLGEQFAGRGHISTSISHKGPYRDGRYILADIAMTFTYHEEFESDTIITADLMSGYVEPSDLLADITDMNDSVEDFIKTNLDYDYIIKQVFTDSKLTKYLNVNNIQYDSQGNMTYKQGIITRTGDIYNTEHKYGGEWAAERATEVLRLFEKFRAVMTLTNSTMSARVTNFKVLKKEIDELRNSYRDDKQLVESLDELEGIIDNQIKLISMLGGAGN